MGFSQAALGARLLARWGLRSMWHHCLYTSLLTVVISAELSDRAGLIRLRGALSHAVLVANGKKKRAFAFKNRDVIRIRIEISPPYEKRLYSRICG